MPLIIFCLILLAGGIYTVDKIAPVPLTDEQVIEQTRQCEEAGLRAEVY